MGDGLLGDPAGRGWKAQAWGPDCCVHHLASLLQPYSTSHKQAWQHLTDPTEAPCVGCLVRI